MSDDLVAFIEARLAEDEQAARAASAGGRWRYEDGDSVGAWTLYDEEWTIASLKTYRYDEYDYAARMPAFRHPWYVDADANGRHIARHDPARVLREVEAKRELLAAYLEARDWYDANRAAPAGELHGMWTALQLLAGAWSDHPDYRAEWGVFGG